MRCVQCTEPSASTIGDVVKAAAMECNAYSQVRNGNTVEIFDAECFRALSDLNAKLHERRKSSALHIQQFSEKVAAVSSKADYIVSALQLPAHEAGTLKAFFEKCQSAARHLTAEAKGNIDALQDQVGEEVGRTLAEAMQALPCFISERIAWVPYMKGGAAAIMVKATESLKAAHAAAKADAIALGHEEPAPPAVVSEIQAHMLCFTIFTHQMKPDQMGASSKGLAAAKVDLEKVQAMGRTADMKPYVPAWICEEEPACMDPAEPESVAEHRPGPSKLLKALGSSQPHKAQGAAPQGPQEKREAPSARSKQPK